MFILYSIEQVDHRIESQFRPTKRLIIRPLSASVADPGQLTSIAYSRW
jgi:hypothetical protein